MTRFFIFAILSAVIGFVPIGLFLQWWLPQDGPGEIIVLASSLPFALIAVLSLRRSHRSTAQGLLRSFGYFLLALFFFVQVFTFIPEISRRIGPWAYIRSMLVAASQEVEANRRKLAIPSDRALTAEELEVLKASVRFRRTEYTFPVIRRTVRLQWLSRAFPYVGLSYGRGRNCLFDLSSMRCTYVD